MSWFESHLWPISQIYLYIGKLFMKISLCIKDNYTSSSLGLVGEGLLSSSSCAHFSTNPTHPPPLALWGKVYCPHRLVHIFQPIQRILLLPWPCGGRFTALIILYIFFNQSNASSSSLGLVGEAFCHALQAELSEYYRLIAILEGQLQANPNPIPSPNPNPSP